MTYVISTAARNSQADHHSADLYDAGFMEIRTGAPPGPNAAPGGTLLGTIPLPNPAHGAAAAGSAALAGVWQDAADAAGVAGHFRIRRSGDPGTAVDTQQRAEGTITGTGGGGDLELDNTNIAIGQQITITTFPVAQPA